jgi:hypothetical protein
VLIVRGSVTPGIDAAHRVRMSLFTIEDTDLMQVTGGLPGTEAMTPRQRAGTKIGAAVGGITGTLVGGYAAGKMQGQGFETGPALGGAYLFGAGGVLAGAAIGYGVGSTIDWAANTYHRIRGH